MDLKKGVISYNRNQHTKLMVDHTRPHTTESKHNTTKARVYQFIQNLHSITPQWCTNTSNNITMTI